jgi:putative membrane protein
VRNLKKLLLVLIVLAIVAVTLLFVLENPQAVALTFLGWSTPQLPVAVLVILALLLGLIVGPLLGTYVAQRSKRKYRRQLKRQAVPVPPLATETSPATVK